jgi:HEAT repeat protein
MEAQISTPQWILAIGRGSRLTQLLLLAVTVLIYSVMSMAAANSLFVSNVGAGNLPLAFILIGLFSLPTYALFSQIVDRYSRPRLFRYALLVAIALAVGLRLLVELNTIPVYYILLIAIFFQWDFHNNILYTSLLTDYFTTLEYKQYAPYIGIAQAVGTLLGGGLTLLLSNYLPTQNLLLCVPLLLAIAFGQLLFLENSQRRLDIVETNKSVGIIESLTAFPDLVKRFPLVLFLALSSFLLVIIYLSSEFLWFNIYGKNFSADTLTGFLGLMRIIISLIQIVILYGVTRPLLRWLGVARLNALYPITTLMSFGGLLLNFNLFSAIALQLNGDALYKAINLPIHQLNYNAIPQEFIGRVRTLSDGAVYSLGLTLAGVVLWVSHQYLSLVQITWLAASLTVILLLIRLPMGKSYALSLETAIRSDTIDLDNFNGVTQLPAQSSTAIRELITSGDRYLQIKGLELAANLGNPSQFLPEVKILLNDADTQLRNSIVKLYSNIRETELLEQFESLLIADKTNASLRETALEILIVNRYQFDRKLLTELLADSHRHIAFLAEIAAQHDNQIDNSQLTICQIELNETVTNAIVRIVAHSHNRELITLIECILPQANSLLIKDALEALIDLTVNDDRYLATIALSQIEHPETLVRVAAFKLLGKTGCREMLPQLALGLQDRDPRVRQQAASSLATYGEAGLSLATEYLNDNNQSTVDAAIAAIGQIRTKKASDILFKHFTPEFDRVIATRKWQQQIPQNDPNWQPLAVAIEDYHQRLLQKVLYVLSCLGSSHTVNSVSRILATGERRELANAVEVLASLSHRRFILPLMPLLETAVKQEVNNEGVLLTPQWLRNVGYKILLEALESKDRWIRAGASIALTMIPSALLDDPDPVVRSVVSEMFPPACQILSPTNSFMNRILLLKNVALFKNLSLDELFAIDKTLETERVLANATIYSEGSWGFHLYIIAEGNVKIVKQLDGKQQEIQQLSTGDYFGEIALFDDAPRWDGAIALEDCTLLKLEKKRFISSIFQRPHIILEICRFLSRRLRETDKYLSVKKS